MANRTNININIRAADYHAHGGEESDAFAFEMTDEQDNVIQLSDGDAVPYQALEPIQKLGIPFYGNHGSHSGDYCAHVFACDGETYQEHPCDEDGDLSLDLITTGPVIPESTRQFLEHRRRCQALIEGAAPTGLESRHTYTVFIRQADDLGTTYITSATAKDAEEAKEDAIEQCRADWGDGDTPYPHDLHVLGIAKGDVQILEWRDLAEDRSTD